MLSWQCCPARVKIREGERKREGERGERWAEVVKTEVFYGMSDRGGNARTEKSQGREVGLAV